MTDSALASVSRGRSPTMYILPIAGASRRELRAAGTMELLLLVAESAEPVGARHARERLRARGFDFSESTATRLLRHLDQRGLTRSLGPKGRVPTEEGRRVAELVRSDQRHSALFKRVLDVQNPTDLLDLLRTRRALEREAARLAASQATEQELRRLDELLERHEQGVATGVIPRKEMLEFHRVVARCSRNRLLSALAEMLLSERYDYLEVMLDTILGSHDTLVQSLPEHRRIVEALRAQDADAAEAAMDAHLSRFISRAEQFAGSDGHALIDRLLTLARSP